MEKDYKKMQQILKALGDENRLMIVDMISCCELCACDILDKLQITQPTLSHHMKILLECNLAESRKEGKNTYYKLNDISTLEIKDFMEELFSEDENCICK